MEQLLIAGLGYLGVDKIRPGDSGRCGAHARNLQPHVFELLEWSESGFVQWPKTRRFEARCSYSRQTAPKNLIVGNNFCTFSVFPHSSSQPKYADEYRKVFQVEVGVTAVPFDGAAYFQ